MQKEKEKNRFKLPVNCKIKMHFTKVNIVHLYTNFIIAIPYYFILLYTD